MAKLLSAVLGAIILLAIVAGGPAVWWIDRHFAGWSVTIGPKLPFVPCCRLRLGLPPGLAVVDAERLAAAARALATAAANERALTAALDAQSAAVRALGARGAIALAQARSAAQAYRSASAGAAARLALISAPIAGDDPCARVMAVDARLLDSLR